MIPDESPPVRDRLAALLALLGGRAVGLWRVEGEALVQVEFLASPALDPEIAAAFGRATLAVPLSKADLSIVRAAVGRAPFVWVAADHPEDVGSGLWLRAFEADRSVAVPFLDDEGRTAAVLSIAMAGMLPEDEAVIARVRAAGV